MKITDEEIKTAHELLEELVALRERKKKDSQTIGLLSLELDAVREELAHARKYKEACYKLLNKDNERQF